MNTELKTSMEKVIGLATKAGADAADVILGKGNSFSLSAQNNEIDKYSLSGSQVLGVRVVKDSKIGISYTEVLDDDSLQFAVNSAVDNALSSDVNEFETINIQSDGDLIFKSEHKKEEIETQKKIDFCLSLESEVKKRESKVQAVPYNGYSQAESESYYLNSLGTFGFENDLYYSCYTSALIHDGPKNSMHYHSAISRTFGDLDKEECITESLTHAVGLLDGEPVKTGSYDIIFAPDEFVSVFGCFSTILSAKTAWDKTNPFAKKLGQKVAVEGLTLVDAPMYKDAFSKNFFDSEGVKHTDLTLIKDGVLQSFYHNSATAKYFNTETTGHAARGAKGALGVGGTNKVIKSGTDTNPTSGEYIELVSLQGLHSGANAISGEFSFGASGYLCKDGVRVKPVRGITVAGNFYEMLNKISMIGNILHSNTSRSFFMPTIRFADMSVAGN